jgi:DNA-directed RNA polymerase subunit L
MKLNILEDEPKSMIIEFLDADRGIAELIKEKLEASKEISFVGVIKEHPEAGKPRLVIKSEKNARILLLKAIESIQDEIKDLSSQLPKK